MTKDMDIRKKLENKVIQNIANNSVSDLESKKEIRAEYKDSQGNKYRLITYNLRLK